MHCNHLSLVHRAIVTYSNNQTGEIRVRIPAVTGLGEMSITYIGRSKLDSIWPVPSVNEQVIVSADDDNFTNVFWLQTDASFFARIPTYYGAFSDYTNQYSGGSTTLGGALPNVAAPMRFTTTDESNGVSIVNNSRITFFHTGVYNIQWSGQFENTDNAPHDISVWLRKGGVGGVVGSNGRISMPARKSATEFAHTLAGWNYVLTINPGEYYEFMWSTNSTTVSIHTYPESTIPDRPSTASLILTASPVSR